MGKSVTLALEFMFTRSSFKTPDMIEQHHLLNETAALIEAGTLKTTLSVNLGKITAANLKRAHKMLEAGHTLGKIVLEGF
ncbi:MAG: zinc-binding dehydrogenase, partial [Pseudomonadota bacterium]